jgi:hypothetical protein
VRLSTSAPQRGRKQGCNVSQRDYLQDLHRKVELSSSSRPVKGVLSFMNSYRLTANSSATCRGVAVIVVSGFLIAVIGCFVARLPDEVGLNAALSQRIKTSIAVLAFPDGRKVGALGPP